jgi:hypothetical protein
MGKSEQDELKTILEDKREGFFDLLDKHFPKGTFQDACCRQAKSKIEEAIFWALKGLTDAR